MRTIERKLVKGENTIVLSITLGSDAIFISGDNVGVMHLKVSGAKNIELVLPMRTRLDTSVGSEISIGTSVPSQICAQCEYFINVHIAPFKGPGRYDSKPGLYIIDVQVIPGGNPDTDDYRWATSCEVLVRDPFSGSFDCKGLANINDISKHIDVSGNWVQPK